MIENDISFSLEQLRHSCNYDEVCQTLFKYAKDQGTLEKLKEILYTGKSGNYCFKSKYQCKDNPRIEAERRVAMASLLIRNPETFVFFQENNIQLFHGTNANALPSILKYGLNSYVSSVEKGIPVITGEEWSRETKGRDFISFTDVLSIGENYSGISSKAGEDNLAFGVLIGLSEEGLKDSRVIPIGSDISEIGVAKYVNLDAIECLCVPNDKVKFVKKMLGNTKIKVLGMSDVDKKAYAFDDLGPAYIFTELYESSKKESKKFSLDELKRLAKSHTLSKIKEFVDKIKNSISTKGDEINERRL